MRRFVTVLMTLLLLMVPVPAQANTPIRLVVNGTTVLTDVPPVIENGRTLVPVRVLSEALGFEVGWDAAARTVTLSKGDRVIILYIGRGEALVNGQPRPLDVPPFIREGRTLIPVRFVAESLGLEVSWDPVGRVVGVLQPGAAPAPAAVDPEVQALWDGLRSQQEGHITGTITTEVTTSLTGAATLSETRIDGYFKGDDTLAYITTALAGSGESTMGVALYRGQVWQQLPGRGWTRAENSLSNLGIDLSKLTTWEADLTTARVDLSHERLNGIPMSKLTLEWKGVYLSEAVLAAGIDAGEGTTTLTFWVGDTGELQKVEHLEWMRTGGMEIVTWGTYQWAPLAGEIPFPAEIVR